MEEIKSRCTGGILIKRITHISHFLEQNKSRFLIFLNSQICQGQEVHLTSDFCRKCWRNRAPWARKGIQCTNFLPFNTQPWKAWTDFWTLVTELRALNCCRSLPFTVLSTGAFASSRGWGMRQSCQEDIKITPNCWQQMVANGKCF